MRQHRLGEIEDDEPRRKRRRDDDEEDEDDEEEQQPQRKKHSRRSDDPDVEYGSDSSGNEWTLGGLGEGDDDSDLDSDEAFGDSDDGKFDGFTFRGSKSKGMKKKAVRKAKEMDLDEGEESEEDDGDSQDEEGLGLGDDAVDLAAMLDDDEEDEPTGKGKARRDEDEDSGSEEDDEDDESSESESDSEEEDDGDDEERLARMRDRLEALDSSSRQPAVRQPAAAATVDDFLEDTGLEFEKPISKKKKSQKSTTIAAPLPKRHQDKIDREVATQKAKEQLDRWRDTVVRNRRAEFLNFPLQGSSDQAAATGKEKFMPATQQAPSNELEESIQRIMEESGLAVKHKQSEGDDLGDEESALLKAEELAEKKLPVEEVLRRRQELRRQRELLFREEIKAKRIAKIKSKSYRRVHRKERERDADREKQMLEEMGIDPMDEDEKERADRKRAEARMGTKHKDSKWAKSLKQTNRTAWDEDARDGVVHQAKRAEDLKKRIAGHEVSSDEGSDSDMEEDQNDEEFLGQVRETQQTKPNENKGLASLKFMRDAEERKRKANEEDGKRLRKEMAIADGDEAESEEEEQSLGRAIFGPQKADRKPEPEAKQLEFEAPEDQSDDENGEDEPEAKIVTEKPSSKEKNLANGKTASATASGPLAGSWIKKSDTKPVATDAWLRAPKGSKKGLPNTDALDLSTSAAESQRSAKPAAPKEVQDSSAANTNGWTTITHTDAAEASDNDETSNPVISAKEASQSLQQRAFAGDDVETAFAAEKADIAGSEDEKEVSNHLPGWGSWTGDGLSKSIRKSNARAKHNPLYKTKLPGGVKQADRKDANLENVIISEKQDRKGKKYLAPQLPHGYETGEQYERSRRLPMGPEWTTKEVHQRMTRPRVVVKKGVNVQAIEKPLS